MSALCIHFGTCGGCATQDLAPQEYRARKRGTVVRALARHGVEAEVSEIFEIVPGTRRRCVFKIKDGRIGFHARASHDIVDMRECRVLTPGLFALAQRLRDVAGEIGTAELHATEAENGFDLMLRWNRKASPSLIAKLADWAARNKVARIAAGNEILVELAAPLWRGVRLPPGAFLQPTREGEAFLQAEVGASVAKAKSALDLFAGCGTFALALAPRMKVHAVEYDTAQLSALAQAARATSRLKPVTVEKRDLFKSPLSAKELGGYDAAVLDPPRAGAAAQVAELGKSGLKRIAYVSCNADSFARDARSLLGEGYKIGKVRPVDQFLWSEHVELVASFTRD
jgi:23S rRNA (uracil1939-C5)-methyltransferase